MEEQNKKPSGWIKQFIQDLGISKVQKKILATSCFFIFLYFFFVVKYRIFDYNISFLSSIICLLSPIIGIYYTILLYRGTYEKSKYSWIPLAIGITCIFIQSLPILANEEQKVLKIVIALIYISSAVFLYKWETVGKTETRWIPFMIIIFALFFINILLCTPFRQQEASNNLPEENSSPEVNNSIREDYNYSEQQSENAEPE